jgi:omega-amidase
LRFREFAIYCSLDIFDKIFAMEIIGYQTEIGWHDAPTNVARLRAALAATVPVKGSLVVAPEMYGTGFCMEAGSVVAGAEATAAAYAELAREFQVYLVVGHGMRNGAGVPQNVALVYDDSGHVVARYTKLHPFSMAGEASAYPAGGDVVTFAWGGLTVAPLICYDLRFPEVFRRAVDAGAEMFVVVANWPTARQAHWDVLLRARAIENLAYVVGVNRIGTDPQFSYTGGTAILDPQGALLASAHAEPGMVRAMIRPEVVRQWRADFPALRDRRADFNPTLRHV